VGQVGLGQGGLRIWWDRVGLGKGVFRLGGTGGTGTGGSLD